MSDVPSRELQALVRSLSALDGVRDPASAITATLRAVCTAFDWAYGSFWRHDPARAALVFDQEVGDAGPEFRDITRRSSFPHGVGLAGRTWASRRLQFAPDLGLVTDCVRAPAATRAGVKSGVCMPIIVEDEVIGTMDFFSLEELDLSTDQRTALEAVAQRLSAALEQLQQTAAANEARRNAEALSEVVTTLTQHETPEALLKAVLGVVREAFDWQYGSVWRRDHRTEHLRFWVEHGTVDQAFAAATAAAAFPKGVGLSGRTWERGALVFVPDLAEVHDCSRAPAARDAGVRSGVCLPVRIDGEIEATMDFFTTDRIEALSPSRSAALAQVAELTSARLTRLVDLERLQSASHWERSLTMVESQLAAVESELALWQNLSASLGSLPELACVSLRVGEGASVLDTPAATDPGGQGWTGTTWAGSTDDRLRLVLTLHQLPSCADHLSTLWAQLLDRISTAQLRIRTQDDHSRLAEELSAGVRTLERSLSDQAEDSTSQSAAVAEVTATLSELRQTSAQARSQAESLLRTSRAAAETAASGQLVVERNRQGMELIRERVETIHDTIGTLGEHTQQIDHIISTVNEIAEQSKLLALNASIEAARAGEYGRSFSVVANEMRDLAEQSKQATRQVRQLLSDIGTTTASAATATQDGIQRVDEGLSLTQEAAAAMVTLSGAVSETSDACNTIVEVSRQQGDGVSQVADAMTSIDQTLRRSAASLAEVQQVASDLAAAAQRLEDKAVSAGSGQVAAA